MNLTKIFDRIAGKQHERQQSRDADYRKMVTQIADGEDPNPDFVDHVLTDNQQSIDDLRQSVELLLHRRELRATWEKAATMGAFRRRRSPARRTEGGWPPAADRRQRGD